MAKQLDDHHKADLQKYHRQYRRTKLKRIIERAEKQALVEEIFLELEFTDNDHTADDLEKMCEYDPDVLARCREVRFKARRLVVQEFLKIEDKGRQWFFAKYARELGPLQLWPKQWMLNNKGIMRNLDRKKNRLFLPLMNHLCKHRLTPRRSHGVMQKIGVVGHNTGGTRRDYVIVKPLDKGAVATALDTSPAQVYRYLREMARWGIIKDLGRYDSTNPKVYAVGYYLPLPLGRAQPVWLPPEHVSKVRPVWFLKNSKEMRRALREFNV